MIIDASAMDFKVLNSQIRDSKEVEYTIENCLSQRFIASGSSGKIITVNGTPGNALGSYLDGTELYINGNVQDAVGDTMNSGKIIVHGNAGDALGYAMRGGQIFVYGNAGYRTGVHMKAYKNKIPKIVVGGTAGSFVGEYMAGGIITILNLKSEKTPVGNFTGVGMHGGKIYVRAPELSFKVPRQVKVSKPKKEDEKEIMQIVADFCRFFSENSVKIKAEDFVVLEPDSSNPYKRLYTQN